jgi:hypothetical protein
MGLASIFYRATNTTGQGIKTVFNAAFNVATGNRALEKRNLNRSREDKNLTGGFGAALGIVGGLVTGMALAPVVGPLAIVFVAAVAAVGGFGPAQLNAAYMSGKYDSEQRKAKKAGKESTPAAG